LYFTYRSHSPSDSYRDRAEVNAYWVFSLIKNLKISDSRGM
jgi:hypothetical protein